MLVSEKLLVTNFLAIFSSVQQIKRQLVLDNKNELIVDATDSIWPLFSERDFCVLILDERAFVVERWPLREAHVFFDFVLGRWRLRRRTSYLMLLWVNLIA